VEEGKRWGGEGGGSSKKHRGGGLDRGGEGGRFVKCKGSEGMEVCACDVQTPLTAARATLAAKLDEESTAKRALLKRCGWHWHGCLNGAFFRGEGLKRANGKMVWIVAHFTLNLTVRVINSLPPVHWGLPSLKSIKHQSIISLKLNVVTGTSRLQLGCRLPACYNAAAFFSRADLKHASVII